MEIGKICLWIVCKDSGDDKLTGTGVFVLIRMSFRFAFCSLKALYKSLEKLENEKVDKDCLEMEIHVVSSLTY